MRRIHSASARPCSLATCWFPCAFAWMTYLATRLASKRTSKCRQPGVAMAHAATRACSGLCQRGSCDFTSSRHIAPMPSSSKAHTAAASSLSRCKASFASPRRAASTLGMRSHTSAMGTTANANTCSVTLLHEYGTAADVGIRRRRTSGCTFPASTASFAKSALRAYSARASSLSAAQPRAAATTEGSPTLPSVCSAW